MLIEQTPFNKDKLEDPKSAIRDSMRKLTPQTKKIQGNTANCVICLSSLIPQKFFEKKKGGPRYQQKCASDRDILINDFSKPKAKDNSKFMDNIKER